MPLVVMVLIATPMYVCSTDSVPFVAALIAKGMNPGAGLMFLIAGPATNMSTLLAVRKSMGKGTALLYVVSIIETEAVLTAFGFDLVGWL